MRSFDLQTLVESAYHVVDLAEPFNGNDPDFINSMNAVQEWADQRCQGKYILLLGCALCEDECDAMLFKLKYG